MIEERDAATDTFEGLTTTLQRYVPMVDEWFEIGRWRCQPCLLALNPDGVSFGEWREMGGKLAVRDRGEGRHVEGQPGEVFEARISWRRWAGARHVVGGQNDRT